MCRLIVGGKEPTGCPLFNMQEEQAVSPLFERLDDLAVYRLLDR